MSLPVRYKHKKKGLINCQSLSFLPLIPPVLPDGRVLPDAATVSESVALCGKIVLPVASVAACTARSIGAAVLRHYAWWSVGSTVVQGRSCTWLSFRFSLIRLKIKRHKSVNLCRQVCPFKRSNLRLLPLLLGQRPWFGARKPS